MNAKKMNTTSISKKWFKPTLKTVSKLDLKKVINISACSIHADPCLGYAR